MNADQYEAQLASPGKSMIKRGARFAAFAAGALITIAYLASVFVYGSWFKYEIGKWVSGD